MFTRLEDIDQAEIVRKMKNTQQEEFERCGDEALRRGEESLLKMLSQYDDTGHILSEYANDPDKVHFTGHGFWSMTEEERAAYIVSEKKRMGLLA